MTIKEIVFVSLPIHLATEKVTYPNPSSPAKNQCALQLRWTGQAHRCLSLSYFSLFFWRQASLLILYAHVSCKEVHPCDFLFNLWRFWVQKCTPKQSLCKRRRDTNECEVYMSVLGCINNSEFTQGDTCYWAPAPPSPLLRPPPL